MNLRITKITVGFVVAMLGIIIMITGALSDNGNMVSTGSILFPFGFGFLLGSA